MLLLRIPISVSFFKTAKIGCDKRKVAVYPFKTLQLKLCMRVSLSFEYIATICEFILNYLAKLNNKHFKMAMNMLRTLSITVQKR